MKITQLLVIAVATVSLSLTAGVRHVTTQAELNTILAQNKNVIVDFYTTWCGPCQRLAPLLTQLAQQYPALTIVKIDADQSGSLANQFSVRSYPTLIFFKNGSQVHRGGSSNLAGLQGLVKSKFGL